MIDSGSFRRWCCWAGAAAVSMAMLVIMPAQAQTSFYDFENATLADWQPSTTGGAGSIGVEPHGSPPGNKMAFATHVGSGTHGLSHDFLYAEDTAYGFEMHAIAVPNVGRQAYAGVRISLLNAFNSPLGSFSLVKVTTPSFLGPRDVEVDDFSHFYSGTMGQLAVQAGVNPAAAISKVSFAFVTYAESGFNSFSTVWFDNFSIGVVPEPSERAMLLGGLAVAALLARRRRASTDA